MLLVLLACSVDNQLGQKQEPAFDSGTDDTAPATDSETASQPEEECNGVDDDGDGAIDEGFPDDDANGRVDCLDAECPPLELVAAEAVPYLEDCAVLDAEDPWNVVTEWSYRMGDGSYSPPVVGRLVDTSGDGAVDDADLPVILVSDFWGTMSVLYGDGSGVALTLTGVNGLAAPALGDLDGDGRAEIIAPMMDGSIGAFDASGTEIWTSEVVNSNRIYPNVSLADVDGDGTVEVISQTAVINGADGSLRATIPEVAVDGGSIVYNTTVADLDQDGTSEVILGRSVWAVDGTPNWLDPTRDFSEFSAVADGNGDGLGDVITVSSSRWTVIEADGTVIVDQALPGVRWPGPPAVADFDGDGVSEICIADETTLGVYELDGTLLWESPMSDFTGWAGCSGFDVNADGAVDVLLADEWEFSIYDGPTGTIEFQDTNHRSGTGFEYPVVADVDNDGAAEVVVISTYGGANGVSVYGQADGIWPAAGPSWSVHDYAVTNVEDDGHVPSPAPASWIGQNLFHAREATPQILPTPDLAVEIDDVCVADCTYGPVALSLHVKNIGAVAAPAGVPVAIYAVDSTNRLVATVMLPAVPAGSSFDGVQIDLKPADVGPGGFLVVIDDGDTLRECDEGNNTDVWMDVGC